MKPIALFPAFLLIAACSPKADHLAAITCTENVSYRMYSNLGGSEEKDEKTYTFINHYLLNYKTGQVKRWIDKEGAPLVSRTNVRFTPDFISWEYDDSPISPEDVTENEMVLNRETLEISGKFKSVSETPGIGGYYSSYFLTGQCKKTEIPWEKLKAKQV